MYTRAVFCYSGDGDFGTQLDAPLPMQSPHK